MPIANTRFVSLADVLGSRPQATASELRGAADAVLPAHALAAANQAASPEIVPIVTTAPPNLAPEAESSPADTEPSVQAIAVRQARLFHAALSDAFDAVLTGLLRELAIDVLGRELRLARVDIDALARRLVAERTSQEPLRLRVAPADAQVVCDLPVVVDPTLEPGDAILECRTGAIDARLGVRLAGALAGMAS